MKIYTNNLLFYAFLTTIIFFTCTVGLAKTEGDLRFENYLRKDINEWPERVLDDSKDCFLRKENTIALMLAGAASIVMHNSTADDRIQRSIDSNPQFDGNLDKGLDFAGCPGTHAGAAGLWYVVAAHKDDTLNKDRAWTMLTALAITDAATISLKALRHNDTPNGKPWAWPSGHTSSSFVFAAVLDEFYGPGIGIPAYAGASLVAYRMVDTGDHWASDVVFGATLGWIVGHTVAGKHKDMELAGFTVVPYTYSNSGPTIGLNLVKHF